MINSGENIISLNNFHKDGNLNKYNFGAILTTRLKLLSIRIDVRFIDFLIKIGESIDMKQLYSFRRELCHSTH